MKSQNTEIRLSQWDISKKIQFELPVKRFFNTKKEKMTIFPDPPGEDWLRHGFFIYL